MGHKQSIARMKTLAGTLIASSFPYFCRVVCQDGSVFAVENSFLKEDGKYIWLMCERFPHMYFAKDDLISWGEYTK